MTTLAIPLEVKQRIQRVVLDSYNISNDAPETYHYIECSAKGLDRTKLEVAAQALAFACEDLGLRAISLKLKWFDSVSWLDEFDWRLLKSRGLRDWKSATESSGCVFGNDPNTVWVHYGQDVKDIARTVWHETRHVWQDRTLGKCTSLSEREQQIEMLAREVDAFEYIWSLEQSFVGR